jgi:hypothetical protein
MASSRDGPLRSKIAIIAANIQPRNAGSRQSGIFIDVVTERGFRKFEFIGHGPSLNFHFTAVRCPPDHSNLARKPHHLFHLHLSTPSVL